MKRIALAVATLALAGSAQALELSVNLSGPLVPALPVKCDKLIVNPEYSGPDPCILLTIPANTVQMTWTATEGWEKPVLSPLTVGHTRLTCGAVWDVEHVGWSYSCFNSGVIGPNGLYTGSATGLATLVGSWWASQR